jgi:hypothetical protein
MLLNVSIEVALPPLSHVATGYDYHLIPHCVRNDKVGALGAASAACGTLHLPYYLARFV